jgi:hypothetical protein
MRVARGVEACFSNRASRVRHIERALRRCSASPKPLFPGHGGFRKPPATQVFHFLQGNRYAGRLVAVILSREKVPVTLERAFDIYQDAVFPLVYRLTRRPDVAEDVTRSAFSRWFVRQGVSMKRVDRSKRNCSPSPATWR